MTHHKAPDEWEWLPNFVAFWKYKQDSTGNSMTVVTNQGPVMQRPSKNYQAPRVPSTWTWNRGR
ncbi:hypothetical protein [Sporisorium scitamineum]|uniref:Uncharacterized protein n=1 Tax=Sporisorium scitamineum TaxID=49012 RepID=A0A0F7RW57_9BASI|nr:hypothetical protein [Sporisorium scitamineum]